MGALHQHSWTRSSRRGLVLPLVLLALAIAVILGSSFLSSASTATSLSSGVVHRLRARMIAESGLAMTLTYLQSDADWRTNRSNGLWTANQSFDGGTFSVSGEDGDRIDEMGVVIGDGSLDDDPQDPVTLTSIGIFQDARYTVRVTLTPPSTSTLAVSERITVKDGGVIDSYNHLTGAYGGSNIGEDAVISSNAVARPNIVLRDSARVNGDVYFGVGGDPASAIQVLDSAVITGTRSALAAPAAFATPIEPAIGSSSGNVTYSSGTTELSSDLHCMDLTISNAAKLRIVGDRKIVVDGNFHIKDDAMIEIGRPSAYAAAVSGKVELLDSSVIDSYDSSVGPYMLLSAGSAAQVTTTATAAGSISALTAAVIKGDAYSGVGSDPSTAITTSVLGNITGSRSALTSPITIPSPPAWPDGVGPNTGNYDKTFGRNTINGDMQVDSFTVTGVAVVQIFGHRTIRVNKQFVVDDLGKLEILPNSSLAIYVQEYCKFSGTAEVNHNTKKPSLMTIYSRGMGFKHVIAGGARVHAIIDSPNSSLTIGDSAHLFGAFMGQSLLMKLLAQFHHDSSIDITVANSRLPLVFSPSDRLTVYTKGAFTVDNNAQLNVNTVDAAKLTFNHLGDSPADVKGMTTTYATFVAPDATWQLQGQAVYHGKAKARDLKIRDTATVHATASGGTADPGLLAKETIELSGGCILNGIGGSTIIAANAKNTIAISVEDTAAVQGSAYASPGGDGSVSIFRAAGAQITGNTGTLSRAVTIALPTFPMLFPPYPNQLYSGITTTTISGDVECADFEITDDAIVEIEGDITLSMTGALKLRNRGQLRLRPDARLTIFCQGVAEAIDDSRLNAGGDPSRVVINLQGTTIALRNDAEVCATIIAPAAQMSVTDSSDLFGSYMGKRLKVQSQGKVHYNTSERKRVNWVEQR